MTPLARLGSLGCWLLLAGAVSSRAHAAETRVVLDGDVPTDGPDHFFVPFAVPAGHRRDRGRGTTISRRRTSSTGASTIQTRLPRLGRRQHRARRSSASTRRRAATSPGRSRPATWRVVVGKAQDRRTAGALPRRDRAARRADACARSRSARRTSRPAPLGTEQRWYAGDFHVHSRESGDARPPIDEIATFARGRGPRFRRCSREHNTLSQLDFLRRRAAPPPRALAGPGHRVHDVRRPRERDRRDAVGRSQDRPAGRHHRRRARRRFTQQGALVSINHPVLDIGDLCIGCAWKHDSDPAADRRGRDRDDRLGQGGADLRRRARSRSGTRSAPRGTTSPRSAAATIIARASSSAPFDSPIGDPDDDGRRRRAQRRGDRSRAFAPAARS